FSGRSRHTIWPRDWSSDVCSSDLHHRCGETLAVAPQVPGRYFHRTYDARPHLERDYFLNQPGEQCTGRYWTICFQGMDEGRSYRSEERRVGKECRSRWSMDD